MFSAADHRCMARALVLAERGLETTQPNPRVGCVIVRDGQVLGEGWHERAGEAHAEVHALQAAGERARGATAYVSLEPCAHQGRTPPCSRALVRAGVARVVVAAPDPNPKVAGRGAAELEAAGIVVEAGLMAAESRELNRGFFSRMERGRPWLRLKLAMSLDGRTALASGESQWITGEAARADVQHWRARSSAILTGSGTVLADDPRLTLRLDDGVGRPPLLRVVLDRRLVTPAGAHLLDGSVPTLLFHAAGAVPGHAGFERVERVAVGEGPGGLDLQVVLAELARRGVNELQVEVGPTLGGRLFDAGLVDELLLYVAPLLLGEAARPLLALPPLQRMAGRWPLRLVEERRIGEDWRLLLRPAARVEG